MAASCWRVLNRNNRPLKTIIAIIFLCIWFFLTTPLPLLSATTRDNNVSASDFPTYPSIKPNVEFWIDIFTKFSKSRGVIHDTRNLGIIYDVVSLDASNTIRAVRKNKKIQKYSLKSFTGEKAFIARRETGCSTFRSPYKPVRFQKCSI
ncbi:hypothetical protein [Desulfobacula sp.]|uniref:hypothetical protein n=1 Tax=Desulfobacula sp. TaxID=2593537 RepID=UPI0026255A99|nr:hypothetical protein [Desulfobacula sp.]